MYKTSDSHELYQEKYDNEEIEIEKRGKSLTEDSPQLSFT